MADFDPPFGNASERRLPTMDERQNGFPCGPADQRLFNALFYRIESEVGEVINFAGIAPTDTRFTQLREAIQALIAAATGGGDTSQFLLMSQARARLPIFPEALTNNGHFGVTSPGVGSVRLTGGINFLHRGIFPITTTQTDFPTDNSKIYHLRWDVTNGYRLLDLSSPVYNPASLPEDNIAFDSTYDNMLIARVVTNSSNIATITNLMNRARMSLNVGESANLVGPRTLIHPVNFARAGVPCLANVIPPGGARDSDVFLQVLGCTRYNLTVYSSGWQAAVPAEQAISAYGYSYNVMAM